MSGAHDNDLFPVLTDYGVCQVYNARPMRDTFKESTRMSELSRYLDPRPENTFVPKMVNGTGKIFEKTFWINVADRYILPNISFSKDYFCIKISEKSSSFLA